jgi:hypothetical protein
MIDTDAMSTRELKNVISELREAYARKLKQEQLNEHMNILLAEAAENKFAFVDDETGRIWDKKSFIVADMA